VRLHLVGLPHTHTLRDLTVCAYTAKIVKFCEMMTCQGVDVYLYSGELSDANCKEHVALVSEAQRYSWFGEMDMNTLPMTPTWDDGDPPWKAMNAAAIGEIQRRYQEGDLILLTAGLAQKPIAEWFDKATVVEWGVGYEGWFTNYVCFESHAWRHFCYGKRRIENGRFYDTVIPNFFVPGDFTLRDDKDDYLLFVGRVTQRKGPHLASDIAKKLGRRLLVAGPGVVEHSPNKIVGDQVILEGSHLEYLGVLGPKERDEVMGKAAALLAPTLYLEPFGGVVVEAQMCGTPVVTTNFGAFTETVNPFVGATFNTLNEGARAVESVLGLRPSMIRKQAMSRYSLSVVGPIYQEWFNRLGSLSQGGWYA